MKQNAGIDPGVLPGREQTICDWPKHPGFWSRPQAPCYVALCRSMLCRSMLCRSMDS